MSAAPVTGVTRETVTDAQIRRLAHQAAITEDETLAGDCALALCGDADSRARCAARIESDAAADVAAWMRDNPGVRGADLTPEQVLHILRGSVERGRR